MYRHFECSGCSGCSGCWKFVFSWLPRVEQKFFWCGTTYNGHVCPLACVNMSTRFSVSFVFHTTQTRILLPGGFDCGVFATRRIVAQHHLCFSLACDLSYTGPSERTLLVTTNFKLQWCCWDLMECSDLVMVINQERSGVVVFSSVFVCFQGPVKGFFLNVARF